MPLFLQSCLKYEEDLFDKNATERIMEALAQADQVLKGATNGWIMSYYPGLSDGTNIRAWGGYTLLMKFGENDTVTMRALYGMRKTDSIAVSMYELIPETGPLLTFNTHNPLMHYFSAPENPDGINRGEGNVGMAGDYEFIIMEAKPDKVVLKSKKRGQTIIMRPFTGDLSWGDYLTQIKDLETKTLGYTYIYIDGTDTARVTASPRFRRHTFKYTDKAGEPQSLSIAFVSDLKGIVFYEPIELFGKTIERMDFVDDGEDGWLETSTGGKLIPTLPILSELFLSELWCFKYSSADMGTYAFPRWTAFRDGLAAMSPSRELGWATLYQYLADPDEWGFYFATDPGGAGALSIIPTILSDNRVRLTSEGRIRGESDVLVDYTWFLEIYWALTSKTFTLTTDNPKDPSWIKLQEEGTAANSVNNWYILYMEEILYPFRP